MLQAPSLESAPNDTAPVISISRPLIGDDEQRAVAEVLQSGMLAQGPRVATFESEFAEYCGVPYAIATSSGTAALHLALLAHEIGPGDEVITSPFSFVASANAIRYTGATPVFADIDRETFNLDPHDVERRITARTRAIMPVHLFGLAADMAAFTQLCARHGLVLLEDACQAHGATVAGRKAGSFGTASFSFYATKNMTTGEGGMVTTRDERVADRVKLLRNHGMRVRYSYEQIGFNLRMTDLQAALGLVQLRRLDEFNKIRQRNASYFTEHLSDVVECPRVPLQREHVFHQYTVRVPAKRRASLAAALSSHGIGTGIYYPSSLAEGEPNAWEFAETARACEEVLSLPVHPLVTAENLEHIVRRLRDAI